MAIRRRRKTLTNLLSTMERRVTSVELRPINLLTASQIAGALAGEDELDGGPDSVVGLDAPNQYKAIIEGHYYGANLTGNQSRVELYFEADPGLEDDLTVRVSGVHKLTHSGDAVDLEASGDYRTINSDRPPYEGRVAYSGTRDTPDETIDATVLYNPDISTTYGDRKDIIVKYRMSTVEATVSRAKIVFTTPNYFEVGDVVYVDMPSDTPFFGLDGLHRVAEVGSNYIEYDFSSDLDEPINQTAISEERYVHAVAQAAIRDGATWVNTSTTPDTVYVWKDIRWVLFNSEPVIVNDRVPPSPVENLTADDENDTPDGNPIGVRRVTLSWDAPTTNVDGSDIDDLVGYTVWWRQRETQDWEKKDVTGAETTFTQSGFEQGKFAYFTVFARDSGGNLSEGVELEHFTGTSVPTVQTPAAPTATTYLGTIKISYDDLTNTGFVQAATAKEIQVYFSDISGFEPGPLNYYGKFPANAGTYIIIPGTELVDNTDYYIKIIVRDIYGNITEPSDQVTIRARIKDIVTYDMIDVGTLDGQVIIGADIRTAEEPFNDGGLIMNKDGLVAYDREGGQTFRIAADTGQVSIGAYLGRAEAEDSFLTVASADLKYATTVRADGISIVANNAFDKAGEAEDKADAAQEDATQARTDISAGNITIKGSVAANAINADSNTTTINGGKITTGSIKAAQLDADSVTASKIKAGAITAEKIDADAIVGKNIATGATGRRILLTSTPDNQLKFNSSTSTTTAQIITDSGDVYFNKNSGSTGGGFRFGSTFAEISTAAQAPAFCGVRTAFVRLTSGQVQIGRDSGAGSLNLNFGSHFSGQDRYMIIDSTGKVKYVSNIPGILSDLRLKNITEDAPLGLDFISKLKPISFKWKPELKFGKPNVKQFGLVAQELEQALIDSGIDIADQEFVTGYGDDSYIDRLPEGESKEELRKINYMSLVPILIKSTQELLAKIELLESEVKTLKEGN